MSGCSVDAGAIERGGAASLYEPLWYRARAYWVVAEYAEAMLTLLKYIGLNAEAQRDDSEARQLLRRWTTADALATPWSVAPMLAH